MTNGVPAENTAPTEPKARNKKVLLGIGFLVLLLLVLGVFVFFAKDNLVALLGGGLEEGGDSEDAAVTPTPPAIIVSDVIPKNKALFLNITNDLVLGNPNGTDLKPFNSQISSNYGYIKTVTVSPDRTKILLESSSSKYAVASSDGSDLKEFGTSPLEKLFNASADDVTYWGWSSDGKTIVFSVEKASEQKTIIGTYDWKTGDVKELYTRGSVGVDVLYYDPVKGVLALSKRDIAKGYTVNLNDKTESEFNFNDFYINYQRSGPLLADGVDRTSFVIHSVHDPGTPLATIKVTNEEGTARRFYKWVTWSPKQNYLAVKLFDYNNPNFKEFHIYDKTGALVLRLTRDVYEGSIFSSDEKYILLLEDLGNSIKSIEAIEIATGNQFLEKTQIRSQDLNFGVFWFN